MEDWELLQAYWRDGSEAAFAELLSRHVHVIYSAALRQVRGDRQLADDITQRTFCLLADKAPRLPQRGTLIGWLYKSAHNVARETLRTERRRHAREQHAAQMSSSDSAEPHDDYIWQGIAPLLDDAMNALTDSDRTAILLRFFQRKPMRAVGAALGVSEETAKMRVSRAVEKLRRTLAKRGLAVPSGALAGLLWASAVQSAPAATLASLTGVVLLQSAGAAAPMSILTKALLLMAKFNLKTAAVTVTLGLASIGVGIYFAPSFFGSGTQNSSESLIAQTGSPDLSADGSASLQGAEESALKSREAEKQEALSEAVNQLRAALNAPWTTRDTTREGERIAAALEGFGTERKAAVPVLMEAFSPPRAERSFQATILATHGLTLLGTEAGEAMPDLLKLLRTGDLAALNSGISKLFVAIHPDPGLIPELVQILSQPGVHSAGWIGNTITTLVRNNPGSEDTFRPIVAELLHNGSLEVRRNAARTLAGFEGKKELAALPVLIEALGLEKLRDPTSYEPLWLPEESTLVNRDGEKWDDDVARSSAIWGLREFGPEAKEALPALKEAARLMTPGSDLRKDALITIGMIDPDSRANSKEIDSTLASRERGLELAEGARAGQATFDELIEGLGNKESVHASAAALGQLGEDARAALPALAGALERFGDYESAQRLKELEPARLLEAVQSNRTNALYEAAYALGELGPSMAHAVPDLEAALNQFKPSDPRIAIFAEAILKIDPSRPKLVFGFDDLHEATWAVVDTLQSSGRIDSPVYNAYIDHFQDQNSIPRGQVLRFVEETKAEPDIHRLFVRKLLEKHPSLALDLTSRE